ncbi:hypothetical protein ABZ281_12415 [Streptomyces sp. NPDC006265]|uniref:hypothetical protein n=1 Tax=Streptomyces sp. NPDC006265 TaxID=3156740 RepID=UPI00339DD696
MKLYLAGTEIPAYRSLLAQEGHTTVALSYWGLRRRTKFTKPYALDEKFGDEAEILVDSGCHSINSKPNNDISDAELKDIAEHYYDAFIAPNQERLTYYVEFDAQQLGDEWIAQQRERLDRDKAIVVWRPETGRGALEQLCHDWPHVGITQAGVDRQDIAHLLPHLAKTTDTKLFGLGMTKTAALEHGLWYGATSTSWISPSQFGDTIVWAGKELHRYPRRYKDMSRARHKHAIADAGFDADAVIADDATEVLRLSIWSWRRFSDHINGTGVTAPARTPTGENTDPTPEAVDRLPEKTRHAGVTPATATPREKQPFPGLALVQETAEDGTVGRPVLKTVDPGVRTCDRCYLSSSCPAVKPGSTCAFSLPVEIRTKDQRADVAAALLEMQAGRVFSLRFAEELEGGITNPVLSGELDRFNKMLKTVEDMEENSFSVKITATQKGAAETGLISRLFGRDEGEQARSLPEPVTVERAAIETGFVDAEVIEDKAA